MTAIKQTNIIDSVYVDVPKRDSSVCYEKITDNNFIVPKEDEYNFLVCKNYRVSHLKDICRAYKLKVSGNKEQLKYRIYNFLRLSTKVKRLQRLFKKNYMIKYNSLHGPARLNRGICVNDTDFYSMDDLTDIQYDNFYSFKDKDGKIYGFDILSLYKMFVKQKNVTNPYNRNEIPNHVKEDIRFLLRKNKYYINFANGGENIIIEEIGNSHQLSQKQRINLRTIDVFQKMDMLGNYTDTEWFLSLDRPKLIRFIREISDIWHHRAELTPQVQAQICPYGNPFRTVNLYGLPSIPDETLQRISLTLMENLVNTGIDRDRKYLGSSYVLCALTLVNENAAQCLPWLYESVMQSP